tara:strand:- start:1247 stop:1780 length:534 start_codon:yes stop_codon:yes gene_type:complete
MGYDSRNPSFTFRFGEYRHGKLNKLAKAAKMPTVEYVRNAILDPFLNGDLIPKAKDDLVVEMAKLKLEKIKAEIEYLKLKNRYMETFGSPMSTSATRILKPQIVTTPQNQLTVSPYDAKNNIIQCVECSQLFRWQDKDEFLKQKYEFELHLTNNHGRALTYLEKSVLDDLRYSGVSI